jgi:hypothetical protein
MSETVVEPVATKKKRVMSDAQREGLKKGLEALKAKREAMAKAKEEAKAKLSKPIAECLPPERLQSKPIAVSAEPIQPIQPINNQSPTIQPLVKKRDRVPKVNVADFAKFKEDVIQNISQIKSVPAPVIQEKVVQKEVYLTGSALLNKIFNFNS